MILLDFNIQLGKFYSSSGGGINWLDLIVRIATPLLSIWLALYLYNKKKREDKENEDRSKKKESDNDLKYFHTLVDNIVMLAEKQIEEYGDYASEVKANPFNTHQLGVVNPESLNRVVNKFDQQKIFHSYIIKFEEKDNNKAIENFMQLYNSLDIYLMIYNNAILINTKLNENTIIAHNEYMELSIDKIIPTFEKFILEQKDKVLQEKLLLINDGYNKVIKATINDMQKLVINKILDLSELRDIETCKDLIYDCRVITSVYDKIEKNANQQADEILTLKGQVKKMMEGIKDIRQETDVLTKQEKKGAY